MNQKSFNKIFSIVTLVFFLGVPLSAFAFTPADLQRLLALQVLERAGTITPEQREILTLLTLAQSQQQFSQNQFNNRNQQQNFGGQQQGGNNQFQNLAMLSAIGGPQGGGINPLLFAGALSGGGPPGGGGALGSVSQALTLAGALTGNMGLLLAGMITSMLGSLGGGAGATPQRGNVDEQYVAQGQRFGSGGNAQGHFGAGGQNPYYTTPDPQPNATATPAPSCSQIIFIVKDTTVNPAVTKPYPATATISQNDCVLALNTDAVAYGVTIQPTSQTTGAALAIEQVAARASHIFRFATKNTYKFCISSSACSVITVQ